jgi:hypothetical protein
MQDQKQECIVFRERDPLRFVQQRSVGFRGVATSTASWGHRLVHIHGRALSHRQNGIFQAVNCDRIVPVIAATICRVRVFICRITKRRNAIVPTRIRKSFGAKTEKITQSGNTTKRTLHACRFAVYRESDRYNATDLNNNVKKRLTPGQKWKSRSCKF